VEHAIEEDKNEEYVAKRYKGCFEKQVLPVLRKSFLVYLNN
jgi:hypothetical protein